MNIDSQLRDILNAYSSEVKRELGKEIQDVAKNAVKSLKNTSPKKTGKYAKGWKSKNENMGTERQKTTVYNAPHWRLTHLLEKGHAIVNKQGRYGRTSPKVHIKPVEEASTRELIKKCENLVERIGGR